MKTDTYIVTLESGHYEWTREDEIHSYKAAIAAGIKEAQRCGKDIFLSSAVLSMVAFYWRNC